MKFNRVLALVLDTLETFDLIHTRAESEPEYFFRHALVQDAAYQGLLKSERRALHRIVGETLEQLYSTRLEEQAPILAYHFFEAEDAARTLYYFTMAGDAAARIYATTEAILYFTRALELAPNSVSLYLKLGKMLELTSQHERALDLYQEMENYAAQHADRAMELAALSAQITPLVTVTSVFDPARGEALLARGLELAQALGDQTAQVKILWNQLILYRNTNRAAEAIARGKEALALARELDLREQTAFILHDVGYGFAFQADFQAAKEAFTEASVLWQKSGTLPMAADSLTGLILVSAFTGEYDAALGYFQQAFAISQTLNTAWALATCRHNIGFVLTERGEMQRALDEMTECLRLSEQVGFISPQVIVRADLAMLYGALGEIERGARTAQRALTAAETKLPLFRIYALAALAHLEISRREFESAAQLLVEMEHDPHQEGWRVFSAMIPRTRAELALARGDFSSAVMFCDNALELIQQMNLCAFLPFVLYLKGCALRGAGNYAAARDIFHHARREAQEIGARQVAWKILMAASELLEDSQQAAALRDDARALASFIAEHAPPGLRASFLQLPDVRRLYERAFKSAYFR